MQGYAEAIVDDVDLKAEHLRKMLKAVPFDAAFYKVSMDENGEPNFDEVRKGAAEAVMVRIKVG